MTYVFSSFHLIICQKVRHFLFFLFTFSISWKCLVFVDWEHSRSYDNSCMDLFELILVQSDICGGSQRWRNSKIKKIKNLKSIHHINSQKSTPSQSNQYSTLEQLLYHILLCEHFMTLKTKCIFYVLYLFIHEHSILYWTILLFLVY